MELQFDTYIYLKAFLSSGLRKQLTKSFKVNSTKFHINVFSLTGRFLFYLLMPLFSQRRRSNILRISLQSGENGVVSGFRFE